MIIGNQKNNFDFQTLKTMKTIHCILISTFLCFTTLFAKTVTVKGSAGIDRGNLNSARNQALINAQRQAIEQGVGSLIDSKTLSENFQIIRDEIYSASRGFITNYQILEEGKDEEQITYYVIIKAEVSTKNISDKLSAMRLLHKKMGNQRLMIVYHKKDPKALNRKFQGIPTIISVLRQEFNQSGFRVFNEQISENVYRTIELSAQIDRPAEPLLAIALEHRAEILVAVEVIAGKRGKLTGMFNAVKADVRLSVYDVSSGRQIADSLGQEKELFAGNSGDFDVHRGLKTAGSRAAKQAAFDAIYQITDYYEQLGDQGFAYLVVFRKFNQDEEDEILDYLESMQGFKSLSELKNSPEYLEIELFSTTSKSRLRRQIRHNLIKKSIPIISQESAGNRLVFMRKN